MPPTEPPAPDAVPDPAARFYADDEAVFELALHEPGAATAVPERLIQDLWQSQRFEPAGLATTSGEPVVVLDPGRLNPDAGPDFSGARVRVGETEWRGSVEVHATSGGWFAHRHHTDRRYDSVVLHVTLHPDVWTGSLVRADGTTVPEVVLYPRLARPLRELLYLFYTSRRADPICAARWGQVPEAVRAPWLAALGQERLAAKTRALAAGGRTDAELEQLLYEHLFAGLGYAKNTEAMASLARRIPLSLARALPDPLDLEALFFGVAGLLPTPADLLPSDRATADYAMELRERFERLHYRYDLPAMDRLAWQFFRLRPANFPPLRIAQGVALLTGPDGLLHHDPLARLRAAAADALPVHALRTLLHARPTPFWEFHLRLDRATKRRDPSIGLERIDALLVNAVVPLLLLHAGRRQEASLEARLLHVLHTLPAEQDEVTRRFADLGTRAASAFEAQALHALLGTRCREARCLSCAVGTYLLQDA